jgi:hypothetical protein
MTTINRQPDDIRESGPDKLLLYIGSAMFGDKPADRMFVYHFGNEEEVLVLAGTGERKVLRVGLNMEIMSSTPAVDAGVRYRETLQEVSAEDQDRLLAIYDLLPKRSFK